MLSHIGEEWMMRLDARRRPVRSLDSCEAWHFTRRDSFCSKSVVCQCTLVRTRVSIIVRVSANPVGYLSKPPLWRHNAVSFYVPTSKAHTWH